MGKLFSSLGREIKLGFKTVTFQFKQYLCFFLAILAMQVMFGIIVMSSSNNIYQYEKKTMEDYDYHFALTNLSEKDRDYFGSSRRFDAVYEVDNSGAFVEVYINRDNIPEGEPQLSLDYYKNDFIEDHVPKLTMKAVDINIVDSPLFELDNKIFMMRVECAAKLLVLALVSVAVIILLFNIRLNHFKFTYGIYMSFGADTKRLFSTSFWEMMVIGLLTLIPAGAIATVTDWYFYVSGDYAYRFTPWLMAFALLFMIPVLIAAVLIPIKVTASKPPLKLLLAEDNSNLVSSPRISTQLLGKKFPGSYEGLGIWRFRRYVATLVASSVLFASIFVWITFFEDVYDFTNTQAKAEFTITANSEEVTQTYYIDNAAIQDTYTTSDEWFNLSKYRKNYYDETKAFTGNTPKENVIAEFESYYYSGKYNVKFTENGKKVADVTRKSDGESVWEEYKAARAACVKEFYAVPNDDNDDAFNKLEKFLHALDDNTQDPYQRFIYDDNNYLYGILPRTHVKEKETVYSKISGADSQTLENMVYEYGYISSQYFARDDSNFAYISLNVDDVRMLSGYKVNQKDRTQRVTTKVDFQSIGKSKDVLNFLMQNYEIEGQPEIIDDPNKDYIIISEMAANRKVLDIDVGDTVQIVYSKDGKIKVDKSDNLLDEIIRNTDEKYKEEDFKVKTFEVCAVVKDMPSNSNLPVFLCDEDFVTITGHEAENNQISVYIVPNVQVASVTAISELYEDIVEWCGDFATVTWNNSVAESFENQEMRNQPVIQLIAVFALVLSPLFWFFSQIMFFGKREMEFRMLRGMGATEKEIKKIFRKDGLILGLVGMLTTVVFSIIGIFAIHWVNMTFVARVDTESQLLYKIKTSFMIEQIDAEAIVNKVWVALIIAVVVTLVCAYVSAMIPYYIDRKKARKTVAKEYGEE